jgi:AcrR family transcriptional regulator
MKMDRRVRKTRDALGDALIHLMQEKPFDSIPIQQVLHRAGVGRSTFYAHFRGKEDLFLTDVEDFFEMMATALTRQGDKSNRLAPVNEFFAHVADGRKFISSLTQSQKLHEVFELGQGHFARGIEARLAAMPATRSMNPVGRAARAQALAGALFSLLNWWINHENSASPQQMDDLFHKLAWSGMNPPAKRGLESGSQPSRPNSSKVAFHSTTQNDRSIPISRRSMIFSGLEPITSARLLN